MQLEQIEVDLFRGRRTNEPWKRVFGGQVIAQALGAACRTVDNRLPHSLHGYFMRPGDPTLPIVYRVERDRDGRSFSSRRVVAIQQGKPLLNLAASFHVREAGLSYQIGMPEVPPPEELLNEEVLAAQFADLLRPERRITFNRTRPIEFRPVDQTTRFSETPRYNGQSYWFRAVAPVPDDQILHRVLLAYASDTMLLGSSLLPHGKHWMKDPMQEASLDHALWFHEDLRIDEWLLYVQDSHWSGGGRGLSRGLVYSRDGKLVASVAQEGLIRMLAE